MSLVGSPAERLLLVDDDPQALQILQRVLSRAGHECVTATSSSEARDHLNAESFPLILSDVNMPGESGLKLVEHVLSNHPRTAAVMVTGIDEPEFAGLALANGAYGYIIKPYTQNEIVIAVANALRRRSLELENNAHRDSLEQIVAARTAALERSGTELRLTREETVRRLSRAIEYRDEETGEHTERMSRYAALLAARVGLDFESIRLATPLHDVGKVALPDGILLKPGKLTAEERREMERHAEVGYRILTGSGSALLELAATVAWTHHEKFDGSGYPRGLKRDEIPVEGQISAVADVFDALTSDRPYRPAFPVEEAVQIMHDARGAHFSPYLLDKFCEGVEEVVAIGEEYADEKRIPEGGRVAATCAT
jgi:putative two-component system response regulator